jgi:glycosyltransferase involved in cell wall biosynthesis
VPVIATDAGGISEIIEPGKSGLLVAPGDVAGMVTAARRILADPELARSLTREGLETFRAKFTHDQYVRGVSQAYDDVLSR